MIVRVLQSDNNSPFCVLCYLGIGAKGERFQLVLLTFQDAGNPCLLGVISQHKKDVLAILTI